MQPVHFVCSRKMDSCCMVTIIIIVFHSIQEICTTSTKVCDTFYVLKGKKKNVLDIFNFGFYLILLDCFFYKLRKLPQYLYTADFAI